MISYISNFYTLNTFNVRPDILGLRNIFRDLAPSRNLCHIAADTLL